MATMVYGFLGAPEPELIAAPTPHDPIGVAILWFWLQIHLAAWLADWRSRPHPPRDVPLLPVPRARRAQLLGEAPELRFNPRPGRPYRPLWVEIQIQRRKLATKEAKQLAARAAKWHGLWEIDWMGDGSG